MTATERARKLAALNKLFQGNDKPARALMPPMMPDLSVLNVEQILTLQRLQQAHREGRDYSQEEAEFDRLLNGLEIPMKPVPIYPKFMP